MTLSAPSPAERLASTASRRLAPLIVLPVGLLAAAGLLTQLLAHRLGYPPVLRPLLLPALPPAAYLAAAGGALILAGLLLRRPLLRWLAVPLPLLAGGCLALVWGPLYPPLRGLAWLPVLLRSPESRPWAVETLFVSLAFASVPVVWVAVRVRRADVASIAHGSARFATTADLKRAGLLGDSGVRLGGWARGGRLVPLADGSEAHVLAMMPTGAGKTTGLILPTLLSDLSSAFVLDPKGELWRGSAGWRSEKGHRCLYFSPTLAGSLAWNPFEEIRDEHEVLDLRVLAEALITRPPSARDDHWSASAQRLFLLLALHLRHAGPRPTLAGVRSLLNTHQGYALFETLQSYPHDPSLERGFCGPDGEPSATHPEVALLAGSFLTVPDRELGSIVSTLNRFLALWAEPAIARNTSHSEFSLAEFLEPEPTTLYISVPYRDLRVLSPLLRALLAHLIRFLTDDEATGERGRTLCLLDEFAALGRLPILEDMIGFFRGYGVRAVVVVQDLSQLHRLYTQDENLSGNCQIHVVAATQSARTRSHASGLAGTATVAYRHRSLSAGRGLLSTRRATVAPVETRRPLLTPGELGTLAADRLLIVKTGMPPILAYKTPYFGDPELARRAAIAPPGRGPASPRRHTRPPSTVGRTAAGETPESPGR